jgi:hypothetical protein
LCSIFEENIVLALFPEITPSAIFKESTKTDFFEALGEG